MAKICDIEGCGKLIGRHGARTWCPLHYQRWQSNGDPLREPRRPTSCTVEGCGKHVQAHGWCAMHYRRWRVTGDLGPATALARKDAGQPCSVDGCDKPSRQRGWCPKHYQRWRRYGDPEGHPAPRPTRCSVDGCDQPVSSRSMCNKHYLRMRSHGSTDLPKRASEVERFWSSIDTSNPDDCWPSKRVYGNGYGYFSPDGPRPG
jgi:hypothetical protein